MASASNKRTRRAKRTEDEGEPEFQVAPMIDVLLVLTLFFMSIVSTEVLKKDKNLQLADAQNGKVDPNRKKPPGEVVVNVSWNHGNSTAGFSIDGRAYPTADSLEGYLAGQIHSNPASYALIRADKDVQYSNIADVMSACASAGISTVNFAVVIQANKAHAATAPAGGGQ